MTSSWFIASCVAEVRVIAEAVEASDVPVKEVAPISKRKEKAILWLRIVRERIS